MCLSMWIRTQIILGMCNLPEWTISSLELRVRRMVVATTTDATPGPVAIL